MVPFVAFVRFVLDDDGRGWPDDVVENFSVGFEGPATGSPLGVGEGGVLRPGGCSFFPNQLSNDRAWSPLRTTGACSPSCFRFRSRVISSIVRISRFAVLSFVKVGVKLVTIRARAESAEDAGEPVRDGLEEPAESVAFIAPGR